MISGPEVQAMQGQELAHIVYIDASDVAADSLANQTSGSDMYMYIQAPEMGL